VITALAEIVTRAYFVCHCIYTQPCDIRCSVRPWCQFNYFCRIDSKI